MRPHITSVVDLKLNYILTLLTYPWYTKQTREHKAWRFSIFITATYSSNWKISPASCGTLTSCWNLLHQTNGLYYTRDRFISANLLGWQKPTEFSTFHQSCQQVPGFGRLTNKILLVKTEILSPGPVAASLPHTENRSQLSTSDHCLKGHLKAYIWGNFFL